MKVVKVGGSLLDRAGKVLELLAYQKALIVPGGGVFADAVRELYSSGRVGDREAHFMAIIAMDAYGLWLERKCVIPASASPYCELPAILLPYRFIMENDELPHSWEVTSDSIAYFIGAKLKADEVVLLKSVEFAVGGRVPAGELREMKQDVVDSYLPELVERYGLPCRVVRAREVRLKLEGGGTSIVP